ncbi:hypothetical protein [Tepidicaulis sp.]|uniref:hypothetical protein n=1 Tax=Tepidicaulis sp. TaxID=1920809 RepID=UPI003B5AD67A
MRASLVASFGVHAAVIAAAFIALPSADPLPAVPDQALPVELVTIDEFTNLKREKVAKAEPKPQIEEESEPEPEPEQAPEPEPAPEPKPAPQPAPAAVEPPPPAREPEPLPEPEAEPEEKKAEPEKKPEPPKPAPQKPAPPKPAKKQEAFDPTKIAALLDKLPEEEKKTRQPSRETKEDAAPQAPQGVNTKLTVSEIDAFKLQMRRCWSVPAGAPNADKLIVEIKVFLNPDGSLARAPELMSKGPLLSGNAYYRAAADSALRAIRRCEPFKMPADKYSSWQELDLRFDPREMLGG